MLSHPRTTPESSPVLSCPLSKSNASNESLQSDALIGQRIHVILNRRQKKAQQALAAATVVAAPPPTQASVAAASIYPKCCAAICKEVCNGVKGTEMKCWISWPWKTPKHLPNMSSFYIYNMRNWDGHMN
ncbi:hypothetical protein NE237_008792 [Protea cynaroides]|uniref:Uncharacterized protein n=1 Tax=Protea cynaroides TaxID=273540 RepID=A0A9Q0R009_9MAGN|nr:hypothetical protein NE237_008792 [Protea cynaroides]